MVVQPSYRGDGGENPAKRVFIRTGQLLTAFICFQRNAELLIVELYPLQLAPLYKARANFWAKLIPLVPCVLFHMYLRGEGVVVGLALVLVAEGWMGKVSRM